MRRAVLACEIGDRSAVAGEVRQRLVERRLPGHVERGVEQLVQHDVGQGRCVVLQQVGQQRVGEPAQRAEGRCGARGRVEPRGLKAPRFRPRGLGTEESFVSDPADDREPPRVRLQARPRGRGHHEDRRRRRQSGNAGVALSDAKAEFPFGERAHAQHEAQLVPGRRVDEVAVLEHGADRLAVPQNPGFFVPGAQDVQRTACRQTRRTGEPG